MNIEFADSFGDSIKKLIRHQTWWYKTYKLFRYDLPRFFKNVWTFRKALWNHYWFDHHGILEFVEIGLTDISDTVEKYGNEIDESRLKKVASMRRAIELIKNYNQHNYVEMSEKELGKIMNHDLTFEPVPGKPNLSRLVDNDTEEEKIHKRKVFDRAREIENQEWDELFTILKGQDTSKFDSRKDWYKQFDGSGLKNWWD
jgi:hypothetical protein